jgi:hypothetical protein
MYDTPDWIPMNLYVMVPSPDPMQNYLRKAF